MGRIKTSGQGERETSGNTDTNTTDKQRGFEGQGEQGAGKETGGKLNNEISESTLVIPVPQNRPVKNTSTRSRKKKEEKAGFGVNDISNLISGVFNVVSLKAGEHWQLADEESQAIAKPLCNILDKMDLLEKASNISDGAGLAIACLTVFTPRVMVSVALQKQKSQPVRKKVETVGQTNGVEKANTNGFDRPVKEVNQTILPDSILNDNSLY